MASRIEADGGRQRGRTRSTSAAIWRSETRPYWMTRDPPLNWVGVTFASSAPWIVSNTSFATLSPSWTNDAPMTVSAAVRGRTSRGSRRSRCRATTGTIVAVRNGSRVARKGEEPERQPGLDRRPAFRRQRVEVRRDWPTDRSEYSKNGVSARPSPRPRGRERRRVTVRAHRRPRPQTVTWRRSS